MRLRILDRMPSARKCRWRGMGDGRKMRRLNKVAVWSMLAGFNGSYAMIVMRWVIDDSRSRIFVCHVLKKTGASVTPFQTNLQHSSRNETSTPHRSMLSDFVLRTHLRLEWAFVQYHLSWHNLYKTWLASRVFQMATRVIWLPFHHFNQILNVRHQFLPYRSCGKDKLVRCA